MPIDQVDDQLNGLSSVCTINAICPEGADYSKSRKATIQLIDMASGGACSGSLVNNTGNSPDNCKPYILTASHCQGDGSLNNSSFNQTLVRFNFERPDCAGTMATNGQSILGVNVEARSNYHDNMEVEDIDGDFMILSFRETIPTSFGAVLAGWNRDPSIATTTVAPQKFIGFHHPNGDNKKLSTSNEIESLEWPSDVSSATGTRWFQQVTTGYLAPGSSGSSLFDGEGRAIGIASVASFTDEVPESCFFNIANDTVYAMDLVWYDKLSHGWEYATDGTGNNRKIKPWLDSANTGVMMIDPVSATCTPLNSSTVKKIDSEWDAQIAVFPNPSSDGQIQLQYNLKNATDLQISVVDINGRVMLENKVEDAERGRRTLDLSKMSDGIYIIKISSGKNYTFKKVVLRK